MKRIGEIIKIKPDGLRKYADYHANPWPEVNAMIRQCNIRNYTIFQRGDYLFAYYEYCGDNFKADMEKMAADLKTQEWWDLVKPLMEPLHDRAKGEWWASMNELYHLD